MCINTVVFSDKSHLSLTFIVLSSKAWSSCMKTSSTQFFEKNCSVICHASSCYNSSKSKFKSCIYFVLKFYIACDHKNIQDVSSSNKIYCLPLHSFLKGIWVPLLLSCLSFNLLTHHMLAVNYHALKLSRCTWSGVDFEAFSS